MCKLRAITSTQPYNLYSGVDAAGSVLFYEPINPLYIIPRLIFTIYATCVIAWSIIDFRQSNINCTFWFAYRINWISLLIWFYFILSTIISSIINYKKMNNERSSSSSLLNTELFQYFMDHNTHDDDDEYIDLLNYRLLYKLHKFNRFCLQLSISSIIFISIMYYIHYTPDTPLEIALNINTHGILTAAIVFDYLTSCMQIQYIWGSLYILSFNVVSLLWTFIFYRASFINPFTGNNILYPVLDWSTGNYWSIFQVWIIASVAHWLVHMITVYLKFVIICYWIDKRHFIMDIVDTKPKSKSKPNKIKIDRNKSDYSNSKYSTYEFEPLLL